MLLTWELIKINNMKNVQIMTLLSVVALMAIPASENVHATVLGGTFTSGTQYFYCTNDLTNEIIVSGNVDTCNDLQYAADKWNVVTLSNWDLNESPTQSISVSVWTAPLGSNVLGVVNHDPCTTCNPYTDAHMWFNSQLPYGDISDGDSSVYNDYESVAIHEFGHVAGIGHDTNTSSVMYDSLATGTEKETLHSVDIIDIRLLY